MTRVVRESRKLDKLKYGRATVKVAQPSNLFKFDMTLGAWGIYFM